jgi:hypothetical protein
MWPVITRGLSPDVDEGALLELGDRAADGRDVGAHVLGETLLAREAEVVVPGIAEQQGVDRLRISREIRIPKNEVGELREAMLRYRIGGVKPHVLFDCREMLPDVLHIY